jgi:hypothetical protein
MTWLHRIGTALLLVGGLALAGLMAYVALGEPGSGASGRAVDAEIAVVLPGRDDWQDLRQGVLSGARRGLVRLLADEPDRVTVATEATGRLLRFTWRPAHGEVETAAVVRGLTAGDRPAPLAVVGSSNTSLTVALAEGLWQSARGASGPLLLIPWATATEAPARRPGAAAVPLLDLYPGRSFRFGPDNARQASLVVRAVRAADPDHVPALVVLVRDPADPYSVDLARGFEAAVRREAADAALLEQAESVSSPGLADQPGPAEDRCAARAWERVRQVPRDRAAWLVLALQGEPIRRMLRALEANAPADRDTLAPLHVLCGDGIGASSLQELVGLRSLSVWCVTTDGPPGVADGPGRDAIVPAEIASAVAWALDHAEGTGPGAVAEALRRIDLRADDPAALGRPLAFDARGERRHDDLGYVLALPAGGASVLAHVPIAGNRWAPPAPVAPVPMVAGP